MNKKLLLICLGGFLLFVVLVLTIYSCSGSEEEKIAKDNTSTQRQKPAKPTIEDQAVLGLLYITGEGGFEKDPAKGVELLKKAAIKGHQKSLHALGHCYAKGIGVVQDYEEALKYYKLASKDGEDYQAMYTVGTFYSLGKGVNKDHGEAFKWYKSLQMYGVMLLHNYVWDYLI